MKRSARASRLLRHFPLLLPLFFVLAACAPSSGIFASGNWQTGSLPHEHIRSLAVDPNNPQNIYAGDAQDGVFVSTDGGTTWKQMQNGLPPVTAINALGFDDAGKKLYAATDTGVYASADAAKTWSAIGGLPPDRYTSIAFDPSKEQIVYAGSQQHGVFSSLNSGASWSAANGGLLVGTAATTGIAINGLTFDSSAHQLWAATSMGVYRSLDGGRNWQALNNGLPAGSNVFAILPASNQGGKQGLVYAGTNKGFYLSQNAGANWQASETQLTPVSIYAITIDVNTITTVYIATGTVGVLRSTDSGESWSVVATGLPSGQQTQALVEGTTGYGQLFAAVNNVYLYPGNGSIFNSARLLPLLLIVVFFYLLIRLSSRSRKRLQNSPRPERSSEPGSQGDKPNEPA